MNEDEPVADDAETRAHDGVRSSDDPRLGVDDSWVQVAQTQFDPAEDRELTTAIVTAIADAAGIDPMELRSPLLYDVVDAPAIEQAFFGSGGRDATGTTQFRYEQYIVQVRSDGWIQVYE